MALSAIYLTKPLVAYTPPFEGKYKSGTMHGGNSSCLSYTQTGVWYSKMKSVWGSDLKILEKLRPGVMVDSTGTLYYIMMDTGNWFGGKSFYTGKITTGDGKTYGRFDVDNQMGDTYSWPPDSIKTIESDTTFSKAAWIALAPCMAQEANGTTDYVHALVYVIPSRWWNASSGPDTEGLLFFRIKKSDLSVAASSFVSKECWNLMADRFEKFTTLTYNKNVFTAVYDVGLGRTSVYWLHGFKRNYPSSEGLPFLSDVDSTYLNYNIFDNSGSRLGNDSCGCGEQKEAYKHCIEPRIMKVGNEYHFATSNGYYPWWIKANPSTGNTTFAGYNPYMDGYDSSNNAASCCYHSDLNVIQHGGQTIALQLVMGKTSRLNEAYARWNASYVSWSTSYVALTLYSWPAGYAWNGSSNRPIAPENCIAVFPVTGATSGYDTSSTTLYKNTHMFVVYNDHIIYAYCYPGRKTHLILGTARYKFDTNSNIHLLTKREFVDQNGNSFGNLTNCSRIIFMDVKNGYLWIVFASVDNRTFYYFCIPAQDIIDHAI